MADVNSALAGNRDAIRELVAAAEKSGAAWTVPRAPGKWSPSQVVEHVALALEESANVVSGAPSKFPTLPRFVRPLVRGLFFNRVLQKKAFPRRRPTKPSTRRADRRRRPRRAPVSKRPWSDSMRPVGRRRPTGRRSTAPSSARCRSRTTRRFRSSTPATTASRCRERCEPGASWLGPPAARRDDVKPVMRFRSVGALSWAVANGITGGSACSCSVAASPAAKRSFRRTGDATTPKVLRGGRPLEYGYWWWTGTTPASRRDGAFMAQGIHGQFLYVNPAAKIVIVVWSAQPHPTSDAVIDDWSLCDAVADALG